MPGARSIAPCLLEALLEPFDGIIPLQTGWLLLARAIATAQFPLFRKASLPIQPIRLRRLLNLIEDRRSGSSCECDVREGNYQLLSNFARALKVQRLSLLDLDLYIERSLEIMQETVFKPARVEKSGVLDESRLLFPGAGDPF